MSKIKYETWGVNGPSDKSYAIVEQANEIIREFSDSGYTLTLRQLYYQFVGRGLLENTERSYKNLGTLVTKARLAGLISWTAIEDRNRGVEEYWTREEDQELIDMLRHNIRFDRWGIQPNYVEVWVEKEALGNVVERACDPWLVPRLSCKGYLSASEAWRAGQRIASKIDEGKKCTIIHLGDHDPSGIDMTRDNQDRLDLFTFHEGVEVKRIALNRDQIDEYSPPPNPTKVTDSRAGSYLAKHGSQSWELDALRPQVIVDLIQSELEPLIDMDLWNSLNEPEQEVIDRLVKLADNWPHIKAEILPILD